MAPRIRFGRRAELPLIALAGYISSGVLMLVGSIQGLGSALRGPLMIGAILVFLTGALVHIFDKIDRKMEESIAPVWDAGERAGERHRDLVDEEPTLAVVHDLSPR